MRPLNMHEIDYLRAELVKAGQARAEASQGQDSSEISSLRDAMFVKSEQINELRAENDELKRRLQELEPSR